jgi:hypothetical protein
MNKGGVGEDRGSKEMDRCPLTVARALARATRKSYSYARWDFLVSCKRDAVR